MHLAVLMSNTDESAFAQARPKDCEKFTALIHLVRPEWQISCFSVKDGVFPDDITGFDGVIITGSPASVLDPDGWIKQLLAVIRDAHAKNVPMFGACFGHQAIAMALGGKVEKSEAGWAFGAIGMAVEHAPDWFDGPGEFRQYAAHIDHVTRLPEGAKTVFVTDHCPIAGFVIDRRVYTTQNHPEMTADFVADLVEEYAPALGTAVASRAKASLEQPVEQTMFAQSIVRFFEMSGPV